MCGSQKEIIGSTDLQISTKSTPQPQAQAVVEPNETSSIKNIDKIQTSDDRAEVIRSNKTILRRNLRNSLQIPKSVHLITNKQENLTAASLKDLESDEYLAFKKGTSECDDSNYGSSKLVIVQTQKIIEQAFDEKYQLLNKIGQGAHSTVYKALCKVDNKIYAIKKMKNVSFQNWKKMRNIFRMVKLLSHQNVIKYKQFHFDQNKRTAYVVMECCEFNDLRSQLCKRSMTGKSFSQQEILSITKQVTSVLKYFHAEGICHRDLKPENILYSNQSGEIKVIDMDVCGVKKSKNQKFDLWTNTGTLFYRAPQSFQIGYSQKADIWSLGTIVYELITGQVPFQTEYEKDFLSRIRNQEVNFERAKTSKKIDILLRKCLQKDASKRVSAEDLFDQLSLVSKDDSIVKVFRERKRTKYFQESYLNEICLGNILQFSY